MNTPQNRILRLKDVISRTGLSRSSIYAYIAVGTFPRQFKIGLRSIGWLETEIDSWIVSRCSDRAA